MSAATTSSSRKAIVYPDSDGQPMADNTLQWEWIATIKGGLDAVFRNEPQVFVAGDLLWYPVEGEPTIRQAPDVLIAFGRPKGYRGSYRQWEEGGIAPQVVWEILSPGNRPPEIIRKFGFYERYGVEEYYVYNPDNGDLFGWLREGKELREIAALQGWRSPRLGIRFELVAGELQLYGPDGRKFLTYVELATQRDLEQREKELAQRQALQQAEALERLREQLRALGVDPQG